MKLCCKTLDPLKKDRPLLQPVGCRRDVFSVLEADNQSAPGWIRDGPVEKASRRTTGADKYFEGTIEETRGSWRPSTPTHRPEIRRAARLRCRSTYCAVVPPRGGVCMPWKHFSSRRGMFATVCSGAVTLMCIRFIYLRVLWRTVCPMSESPFVVVESIRRRGPRR
jgi:hypothetical protein